MRPARASSTAAPWHSAWPHRVLRESLDLFSRCVTALTDGRLALEIAFLPQPDGCLPAASQAAPVRLASVDTAPTWAGVPEDVLRTTDWFWLIYPSRVPDQYPDFEDTEFITSGMGMAPNGGPLFISDDRSTATPGPPTSWAPGSPTATPRP